MNNTKYMGEEAVIKKAMGILVRELGPMEAVRFVNMPKRNRQDSVIRHREWQKHLDKEQFFAGVFSK